MKSAAHSIAVYEFLISLFKIICFLSVFYHLNEASTSSENWWNCSQSIDFNGVEASLLQLSDWEFSDGVIQISIPTGEGVQQRSICYPKQSLELYRQFSYLSHVFCRQLGYMTYSSWHDTVLDDVVENGSLQLQSNAFQCQGYEQSLAQCKWASVTLDTCNRITAVKCNACHKTFKDIEGVIVSPGYPYAYFYTVLCEWDIIVPKDHELILAFRRLDLPLGRHTRCESDTAHLEIISFSGQTHAIKRICATEPVVENLRIDEHQGKVKIKFHSGIFHSATMARKNYGFSITYKVEKIPHSSQIVKAIIISVGFIAFLVTVGFCFICQRYCCNVSKKRTSPEEIALESKSGEIFLRPPSANEGRHTGCENTDWSKQRVIVHDNCSVQKNINTEEYEAMITPTERIDIADSGTYNMDQSKRFCRSKLRTILLSKFTPQSDTNSNTSRSVSAKKKPPPLGFQIYRSLSSVSDLEDTSYCCVEQDEHHRGTGSSKSVYGSPSYDGSLIPSPFKRTPKSPNAVPTIVVECIDTDSPASGEAKSSRS